MNLRQYSCDNLQVVLYEYIYINIHTVHACSQSDFSQNVVKYTFWVCVSVYVLWVVCGSGLCNEASLCMRSICYVYHTCACADSCVECVCACGCVSVMDLYSLLQVLAQSQMIQWQLGAGGLFRVNCVCYTTNERLWVCIHITKTWKQCFVYWGANMGKE